MTAEFHEVNHTKLLLRGDSYLHCPFDIQYSTSL